MFLQRSNVTFVEANGPLIYVWLQNSTDISEQVHSKLNSMQSDLLEAEDQDLICGSVLVAQASDQQYYRVRLIRPSFDDKNIFRCFFFDYGDSETLPRDKLYKLPDEYSLSKFPQLARCCMLEGILAKSNDSWPENVLASLSQRLVNSEFNLKEVGGCGAYPVVQLYEPDSGMNIVDVLVHTGFGRRDSSFLNWMPFIPPHPEVQSGASFEIQVLDIDSVSNFSAIINPYASERNLEQLLSIAKSAQKIPLNGSILPQMLCLACIENGEISSYHRAEVLHASGDDVHVRLVDLGKKIMRPVSTLYVMPTELLQYPFLSVQLSLGSLEHESEERAVLSQLEFSCMRLQRIPVTVLHAIGPNHFEVALNELSVIKDPLPYRLLPNLDQRPFNVYLNKSLLQCDFNGPITPAILASSLSLYDALISAFLSHLTANKLKPLPPSAARNGVFCITMDELKKDVLFPIRSVILAPVMGAQIRCLLYEIDTGRQSVRGLDEIFVAPHWAFSSAFCVPVIVTDSKPRSQTAEPRPSLTLVSAIHREPFGTPAGVVVIQEITHFQSQRADVPQFSLPVIDEVIIDDWDVETASESTVSAPDELCQVTTEIEHIGIDDVKPTSSGTNDENLSPDAQPLITCTRLLSFEDINAATMSEDQVTAEDSNQQFEAIQHVKDMANDPISDRTDQKIEESIQEPSLPSVEVEGDEDNCGKKPMFSLTIEEPETEETSGERDEDFNDDGATEYTEIADYDDIEEQHQTIQNCLIVGDRSLFEKQHSVPARMLSENAIANQLLSPSCPFNILITPASRMNSFDPSAQQESAWEEHQSQLEQVIEETNANIVETVSDVATSNSQNVEQSGDVTRELEVDASDHSDELANLVTEDTENQSTRPEPLPTLEGQMLMTTDVQLCDIHSELPKLQKQRSLPVYNFDLSGSTQRVCVTHFESLHEDFFVQLESDIATIEEINESLFLLNSSPDGSNRLREVEKPGLGTVGAGRFPDDDTGILYRCEVIETDPLTVLYVDYGNTEEVSRVLELPSDDPQLWAPALAHRCRLLQTAKSLTDQPERVEDALQEPEARVELLFRQRFLNEKPICYTVEMAFPSKDITSLDGLPMYARIADGTYAIVRIEGDILWLQSEEAGVVLLNLEDILLNIDFSSLKSIPQSGVMAGNGKVCIVTRNAEESSAWRGEIIESDASGVSLLQIDHGLQERISWSDIRDGRVSLFEVPASKANQILQIPRFALPCKLLDDRDAYRRFRLSDHKDIAYYVHFARSIGVTPLPPFGISELRPLEDRASTTTPGFRGPLSAFRPTTFTFPSPIPENPTSSDADAFSASNSTGSQTQAPAVTSSASARESGFVENVFDNADSPFTSPASKPVESAFKPAFTAGTRFDAICIYTYGPRDGENSDIAFFHDEKRFAEHKILMDAFSDVSRLAPVNYTDITIGSMVAARFIEDDMWYRAIVLSKPITPESGPTVYFIDYGNCEKIESCSPADIRQLPPSLSPERIKPFAIAIRQHVDQRAATKPVSFQLDESYSMEVVSSDKYLTGCFAALTRIPVLAVNVVRAHSSLTQQASVAPPVKSLSSALPAQPPPTNGHPGASNVPPAIQKLQLSMPKPKTEQGIRYSSSELRFYRQFAALPKLSPATLEIITGSDLRSKHLVALPVPQRSSHHDNRTQLHNVADPQPLPQDSAHKPSASGGAFSVRPFLIAQLPKTCSTKPFDAKVSWVQDNIFHVQLENEESIAQFDQVDALTQSIGEKGIRVNAQSSPNTLVHRGCLARWASVDGRWYRAVVRNIVSAAQSASTVEVFFVDYGNTDVVPITDLVMLPDSAASAGPPLKDLLLTPVLSLPILKGNHAVKTDDYVKICLEWRPVSIPPYSLKSLEAL